METKSRCRPGGNKGKGSNRRPSPTLCLPPPHPHPLQSQNGEREALHRELGPGTRSVLISTVAAVALESPSQVHRQPITASTPPGGWTGGYHTQPTGAPGM